MYVIEVSPRLTSSLTDAVIEEVKAWQRSGHNSLSGHRHQSGRQEGALGLWIAQTEGAKLWLQVVSELKNRGVQTSSSLASMV